MLYFVSDAGCPVEYVSSGNLVSENGFVHPKRNIDTFVLIMVAKGTLHITQGKVPYDVGPNEFILLFPNTLHYGHKPSEGCLSYYWAHFSVKDPDYRICSEKTLIGSRSVMKKKKGMDVPAAPENFLVPEYGKLTMEKRSHLLFVQLLDFAKRESYSPTWRCHYALSLLLLETTSEAYQSGHFLDPNVPIQVFDVMEWIRTHYDQPLSVASIAERFNYHPTYLTNIFKKHTGFTILTYINRTRIAVSKNLLTNPSLFIYEISDMCGFPDVKYFMKLFKRCEGMTPTQYRKAFYQKKVNKT